MAGKKDHHSRVIYEIDEITALNHRLRFGWRSKCDEGSGKMAVDNRRQAGRAIFGGYNW